MPKHVHKRYISQRAYWTMCKYDLNRYIYILQVPTWQIERCGTCMCCPSCRSTLVNPIHVQNARSINFWFTRRHRQPRTWMNGHDRFACILQNARGAFLITDRNTWYILIPYTPSINTWERQRNVKVHQKGRKSCYKSRGNAIFNWRVVYPRIVMPTKSCTMDLMPDLDIAV